MLSINKSWAGFLCTIIIVAVFFASFPTSVSAQSYQAPPTITAAGGGTYNITDPNSFGTNVKNVNPTTGVITQVNVAGQGSAQNVDCQWLSFTIEGCVAQASQVVLKGASWVLWLSALVFDATLNYTINFASIVQSIPLVTVGWVIFRDLTNMMFIFILLIAAIGIIVGNEKLGGKAIVGRVIITAILINFSLFFTGVIIDASNIVALEFYSKMAGASTGATSSTNTSVLAADSISAAFVRDLNLTTIYSVGSANTVASANGTAQTETGQTVMNGWNITLVSLGGTVLLLVTSFVFLAAVVLFLLRSVILIILMTTSPVAFIGNVFPGGQLSGLSKMWWKKLIDQSLFAPVYMIMIYIVLIALQTNTSGDLANGSFAKLMVGGTAAIPIVYQFIMLIMFMTSALLVAKYFGAVGAGSAIKIGKSIQTGTSNYIKRRTVGAAVGSVGNRLANSGTLNDWAGSKNFALRAIGGVALRNASALRDVKVGGKSFNDKVKDQQEQTEKTASLIKDRTLTQGLLERNASFQKRKDALDKLKKGGEIDNRVKRAQGFVEGKDKVTGKPTGKYDQDGFFGFSHSSRVAAGKVRGKVKKEAGQKKDLELVIKRNMDAVNAVGKIDPGNSAHTGKTELFNDKGELNLEKVLAHKADIEQKILKDTTTANNKINDELHQIDTDINNLKTRLAAAPTAGGRLSLNTELAAKYNYRTTAAQKVLAAADKLVQTAHKQEVEEAKK